MTIVSLAFVIRTIITRDTGWLQSLWVRAGFVFWFWCIIAGAISSAPGYSIGEALIWFRFPLFAMATALWFGRDRRLLYAMLLRYFNPVGAHQSGRIGEDPNGIPDNLMPYIAQVAVGKRDQLTVFGDDYDTPDGTGVRDYIHVNDLASGHLAALDYAARHAGVEAVNLGTGKGHSVLEVIAAFEQAAGRPIPYTVGPRRPGDIASSHATAARAASLLGWQAGISLEQMCEDTWRWQSQNPEGYSD